jgi:Glycosyl hydrolase catalytic core/Bacterial Ig-like domain
MGACYRQRPLEVQGKEGMDAMRGGQLIRFAVVMVVFAATLFATSPASAARTEFYGISQQAAFDSQDLQAMTTARVQTDRFLLFWGSVQPTEGTFRWSRTDNLIGGLAAYGVRSVPAFWGNPDWVTGGSARAPIDTTTAQQQWQTYLKAAVARYGPGGTYWTNPSLYAAQHPGAAPLPVQSWQVWNEPNLKKYFAPDPSAGEYARLLQISYPAIKSIDPNARVVLAGMTGYGDVASWNFLNSLYGVSGVKAYFDAAALHPYAPDLVKVRTAIENFRAVMKNRNDGATPLWITELAWGSANDGNPLNKGLTGQANMLTGAFNMIKNNRTAWNIQRLFWYHLRDPIDSVATCTFCDSAGLIKSDDTLKPSYDAYTAFSAENTPPTVSIASGPPAGSLTNDATPTFAFSSNETGVTFACRVDAGSFKPCGSPYTLPKLSDGNHTLYVKAIDPAGNESALASRSFTVDTVAPTVTAPGQILFAGNQLGPDTIPVRLSWSGTDNRTTPANLKFDLNRRSFQSGAWTAWSSVLNNSSLRTQTSSLIPGTQYQFQTRSRDQAGNVSAYKAGPAFTPRLFQETAATYTGTWSTQSQSDASGGSVKSSNQAGATATFAFMGKSVGVVMPLHSKRGSVNICLDPGTTRESCATVDLSPASSLGPRMIIFARNGLALIQHQVKVTVQSGTADLDGLVTIR